MERSLPKGLVLSTNEKLKSDAEKTLLNKAYVKSCHNLNTFLGEILRDKISFAIIDCDSFNLSADVLKIFASETEFKVGVVIIVSKNVMELDRNDKFHYCVPSKLAEEISFSMLEIYKSELLNISKKSFSGGISARIGNILNKLGFLSKHIGTIYLKRAIEITVENNNSICSLNKSLYPQIGKQYKTQPNNVERNIRNSIRQAFKLKGREAFEKELKISLTCSSFPPNRSFITMVCDLLLSGADENLTDIRQEA